MRRLGLLAVLAGCGRLGFDSGAPRDDAEQGIPGDSRNLTDATLIDVVPLDGPFPAGLKIWLPFDDAPQNTADVVSGGNGRCTSPGCPSAIAGHHGNAFLFDGNDDCIEVPDSGQFGQSQLTAMIWFRQDASDSCSPMGKRVDINGGSVVNSWELETNTSNQTVFTSSHGTSGNQRIFSPNNAITLTQWHHIALTYDGATKRMYIDGTERIFGAQTGAIAYDTHSAWFGCDDNSTSFVLFCKMAIDDFQLYDRALTPSEIMAIASQ
ncbi:MAG TPA: LamG domain-containing protein [Kofleriaceae bacterium]|nr:LamG domain-containing protein [Kofleriaceae bacterium]